MSVFTNEELITDGTDTLLITAAGAATVDGSAVTQPISAASLPLPTGAATAAGQTQPGVDIGDVTVNNASGASAVNIQDGGNSITIDATTLPLPTGAATEATLAAIDAGIPAALGQTTMAASMPVVIASNQTAIPVTFTPSVTTVATTTRVAVSTTVATLSASNAAKTKVIVHNEAGTLYVKLGSGATSTDYGYRLTGNSTLEIEGYAGIVTGIKQSGTTDAQVTEVGI